MENKKLSVKPTSEPIVTVNWSESDFLPDGILIPLHRANDIFELLDRFNMPYPGYDKTSFRIDYMIDSDFQSYEGRQDFGDGDGSLIDHIEKANKYYVDNQINERINKHKYAVNHLVPYLKMHCALAKTEESALLSLNKITISSYERAYLNAILGYVKLSRECLNKGRELPELPKMEDYDPDLKTYINKIKAEMIEEAREENLLAEEQSSNK